MDGFGGMQAMRDAHTRGPWEVRQLAHDSTQRLVAPCDLNKAPVALAITYFGGSESAKREGEANAKLISKSPEMLDALREIKDLLVEYSEDLSKLPLDILLSNIETVIDI